MAKEAFFCPKKTIQIRGKIIDLSRPVVMGIMNITPDSFYDGGKYQKMSQIADHVGAMLSDGATIIDVGAASSRPGALRVDPETEIKRLIPVLNELVRDFPKAIFSVDTYNSRAAAAACEKGAHMVNDISAGNFDPDMFATIARLQVPYIIMHIKGQPENMQNDPAYQDITREVAAYFAERIDKLKTLGVNDVILDPGFGFGKSLTHNYELLKNLDFFQIFELPVMVGISRKSMITRLLENSPDEALNGTTVLNTLALTKEARILRVHDVKEAMEAIKIYSSYRDA